MNRIKRAVAACAALVTVGALAPASVDAFSASNTITMSGTKYDVSAYSCNFYWSSCSYNVKANTSTTKSFVHYGYVKANGLNVEINVSKSPSASISGNNTALVTVAQGVFGKSNTISGQVDPSIFSVSVASKSRLKASGVDISTGWTTW